MNNIDIALTFNDGYIKQATVVMYSVLKNSSREYKYHFWLVTYDLKSEREKEIRRALVEFEEMYSLDIVYIDKKYYDKIPMIGGFGKEANFRLFLPLLLPNVSKVLYLDCDILCLGDISTLYNIDVSNSPYAACSENKYILQVNNPFCYSVHQAFYFFAKYLNISPLQEGFNYANSGVMLINNDYWRQYNYTQRSLDFFVEYKDNKSFVFPDQDIINYLAMQDKNCFVDLAWKYNLLQCHMDNCIVDKVLDTSSERFKIILDVLDNSIVEDGKIKPVIMHYAGENKPWKCGEKCLFYQEYISVAVAIGFVFWKNNNISKLQKNRRMTAKKLIKYMLPYGLVRLSQKNNL